MSVWNNRMEINTDEYSYCLYQIGNSEKWTVQKKDEYCTVYLLDEVDKKTAVAKMIELVELI